MSKKVVIIDDDGAIREILAEILSDEGYGVLVARNGKEGLELLRAAPEPPCAIVLDLMMPEMDGFQFRRAQLDDPALAPIPVIVLSADADVAAKGRALAAAAALRKPIHLDAIVASVAAACK